MYRSIFILLFTIGLSCFAHADDRSLAGKLIYWIAPVEDADGLVLREGPLFLVDTQYDESNIPMPILRERLDEIRKLKNSDHSYEELTLEILEKYRELNNP